MGAMRSLALLALLAAPAVAAACGGSVSDAPGAGGSGGSGASAGGGGSGGVGGVGGIGGVGGSGGGASFDVQLGKVTVKPLSGTIPGSDGPPSDDLAMRVDLRLAADAMTAVVTPRWGEPTACTVTKTAGALTIAGDVRVRRAVAGSVVSDDWTTLTVALSATGAYTGVTLAGREEQLQGDVGWESEIAATASIDVDRTDPELRVTVDSPLGPPDARLPWDAVAIEAAEGVLPDSLLARTSVEAAPPGGPALPSPMLFAIAPTEPAFTASGVTRAVGYATSWSGLSGGRVTATVSAGALDPAGHAAASASAATRVLEVGPPVAAYTLDGDAGPLPGAWGQVGWFGGFTGSDPRCEQSGCAEIGPWRALGCGQTERSGFAGRLAAAPAKQLVVRFRVRAVTMYAPDQQPYVYGPALTLEVASPSHEPSRAAIDAGTFTRDAAPIDDLVWSTPWSDATIELPPNLGDAFGFAIYAGSGPVQPGACGLLPPPATLAVDIDSIALR